MEREVNYPGIIIATVVTIALCIFAAGVIVGMLIAGLKG